jgi:SAM-dependent methyltransferase
MHPTNTGFRFVIAARSFCPEPSFKLVLDTMIQLQNDLVRSAITDHAAGHASDVPAHPSRPREALCDRLSQSAALLEAGRQGNDSAVVQALSTVFETLHGLRTTLPADGWQTVVAACRLHGILPLLHEDPFTSRAFNRPRGYAGDAVMLDYIYGSEEHWDAPEATELGLRIFGYTTKAPASEGVRARRGYIADAIDQTAADVRRPHVLSIAAGHFREASLCAALKRGRLGRVVALDADAESLRRMQQDYGHLGIEPVPAPFARLLSGKLPLGRFDLIYSLGLFDYLSDAVGRRLLTTAFHMLRPGGRLIVANFLPGIRDVGYMEAVMDWKLVYRSRQDLIRLTADIDERDVRGISLFAEENRNIIFLEVRKV